MSMLLLHVSASVSDGRGSCCHIAVKIGVWPTTLENILAGCPSFYFLHQQQRNTCSGCFHLQLVLLEKENGTKIHSMLSIISKLSHGLNLLFA